jgi:hypothetical protein
VDGSAEVLKRPLAEIELLFDLQVPADRLPPVDERDVLEMQAGILANQLMLACPVGSYD